MCIGELKSVDYPTVDDILSNEALKSSGRRKQKKWAILGCLTFRKQFLARRYNWNVKYFKF